MKTHSVIKLHVHLGALLLLLCGCVTPPQKENPPLTNSLSESVDTSFPRAGLWPPEYRAVHRAIITVGRRQYACDGVLDVSPENGWHLAVISPLGLVAEVCVDRTGAIRLSKATALFQERWVREFIARDLLWHFIAPGRIRTRQHWVHQKLLCETAGTTPQARYFFSPDRTRWEGLELLHNQVQTYSSQISACRTFLDWPAALPAEFHIRAKEYELHLRIVQLSIPKKNPGPLADAGFPPGASRTSSQQTVRTNCGPRIANPHSTPIGKAFHAAADPILDWRS